MSHVASKRYRGGIEHINRSKLYTPAEAATLLKAFPAVKFDETVELHIHLGIDPKQTEQTIRGTVTLPHGTGKARRVIVFCKGEKQSIAQQAGADVVGAQDLIDRVAGGWMEFDVAVATPDLMKDVSRLGKVLGPKGLMPSPKAGTVTDDLAAAVKAVKGGRIEFKMDKQGGIHLGIGKRSFTETALAENMTTVLQAVARTKPAAAKGQFLQSAAVTSTMGPGLRLDITPYHIKEE